MIHPLKIWIMPQMAAPQIFHVVKTKHGCDLTLIPENVQILRLTVEKAESLKISRPKSTRQTETSGQKSKIKRGKQRPELIRMVTHEMLNTNPCAWNGKSELHNPLMERPDYVTRMSTSLKKKYDKIPI